MQVEVEARVVPHPHTGWGVLLQLPDGYIVMTPENARELAVVLTITAEEAEQK